MANGLWTDQPFATTTSALSELDCKGRITRQTSKPSEPLQDAPVAIRSVLESEHKLTLTLASSGLRNASKQKVQTVQVEEPSC